MQSYERIIIESEPYHIEVDWQGEGFYDCHLRYDSMGNFWRWEKEPDNDPYPTATWAETPESLVNWGD